MQEEEKLRQELSQLVLKIAALPHKTQAYNLLYIAMEDIAYILGITLEKTNG